MSPEMVQLAMAFPASLGFALMFNLRGKFLFPAALGGLMTWGVYLLCQTLAPGVFFPCLIASAFAAVYSQGLARAFHAPVAIFYIISEIPLIPGRGLYFSVMYAVQGQWPMFGEYGLMTLQFVVAIAFGIGLAWAGGEIFRRIAAMRGRRARQ